MAMVNSVVSSVDLNPANLDQVLLLAPAILQAAFSQAAFHSAPGGIVPSEVAEETLSILGSDQNDEAPAPTPSPDPAPPQSSTNPFLLAPSYGAAIMMSFLAMMQYMKQVAEQGYEITADQAEVMIGTDGNTGLINAWVQAGCDAAEASGKQLRMQAIGSLISASVSAVSVTVMAGGFLKNCTDGIGEGPFQTQRGQLSKQLETATADRKALDLGGNGSIVNRPLKQGASTTEESQLLQQRKQQLIDGLSPNAKTEKYTQAAINEMHTQPDKTDLEAARKSAKSNEENLQNQISGFDMKQKTLTDFMNAVNGVGQAAGSATGGMMAAEQQTLAGVMKSIADALQMSLQTNQKVSDQGSKTSQDYITQMGQLAAALAQALEAQNRA